MLVLNFLPIMPITMKGCRQPVEVYALGSSAFSMLEEEGGAGEEEELPLCKKSVK